MTDHSLNFHVPAGIRVDEPPEPGPAESRPRPDSPAAPMRYLSRPPMWEPPARPTYPHLAFAALPATPPADGPADAEPQPAAEPTVEPPPAVRPNPTSASAVEVRRMVEALLRLTLEIVDRRRRPDQLQGMATQPVIDALAVLSVSNPPGRELGSAALRKIRIVSAGPSAAEICASYARGPRLFAIAGRIERRRDLWVATTLLLA